MQRREFLKWAAISGAVVSGCRLAPQHLHARDQLTAAPPLPKPDRAASSAALRCVLFGDWGSGNDLQKSVARAMAAHSRRAAQIGKPLDFAISLGDNFYNDGVKNPADAQWETKFEAMYPAASMPFPFFAVLGNHDWRLDPNAQLVYGQKPTTRWNMDGFYYGRSLGGTAQNPLADFFFFDTDLWLPQYNVRGLGDRQLRWLNESLAASSAKWKFLVGHHPPFTDGAHAGEADIPIIREIVVPLCQKYGVDTVFSGHDHDLQRIQIPQNPTQFVVCGAGGAGLRPRKTQEFGPFYRDMVGGFLSLEIDQKQLRGEFRGVDGAILDAWTQAPRAA